MKCLQCQHDNASDAKFCNQCGTPFVPRCSTCGYETVANAKFCNQCGAPFVVPTSALGSANSTPRGIDVESRFHALLPEVQTRLQRDKRVTYRTLKYVFGIGQALLEEIRDDLSFRRLAHDEDGKGLVWIGEPQPVSAALGTLPSPSSVVETPSVPSPAAPDLPPLVSEPDPPTNGPTGAPEEASVDRLPDESVTLPEPIHSVPEAERRQLTVMFCDLVGSTDLSGQLDPEDLREVVRAYQETAADIIQRYEGHIAQYLGDGLLIYFGFPLAHEDDAQRAVYTGLGIPAAMTHLNVRLKRDYGVTLAVRIGIHTGPVVIGEMGGGDRHENLALGETPNIAARLEGLAQANTTVISPVTAQLVQRSFVLEELGPHELKGVAEPMMLFAVVGPHEGEPDDPEAMLSGGFDALVGRDEEIGLLLRRWEQSKEGQGQVVLISGDAGLGKSSLVEGLRAHVHQEGDTRIAFRCSPYTVNSALHPVIEHVQRVVGWQREDSAETQLAKLEQTLAGTSQPLEESIPLLASLLSLPLPAGRYPALKLTPQQQRQQTQDLLVAWMVEEADRQPLLVVWEDLHWADPSTLELLGLFIDQTPTVPMLHVLAFRPEFVPPWPTQSHLTPLTLNRLERVHIEALATRLAEGKALPAEVFAHIVTKTDGVPLYVEELTKMLLESDLLEEKAEHYMLTGPLSTASIPATLQDSLMARLDRLPTVREVAQLGAVLGREFAYETLQALGAVEEPTLQEGLHQLVGQELLYQRGRIPRAKYIFRHALIRDAAYQSLLRRTRQQVHQQVAQLLEDRFPEVVTTQPELMAHHYSEGGCPDQAVVYWQQAGAHAVQRSAHLEAIAHFKLGLDTLDLMPETPERKQQELALRLALGPSLRTIKGIAAPEVEQTYVRARELCHQVGDIRQRFQVLRGLFSYYLLRPELQTARDLAIELLRLSQDELEPMSQLVAHWAMGCVQTHSGALLQAREQFRQGLVYYHDPQLYRSDAVLYGNDSGVASCCYTAYLLWAQGYPDQAQRQCHDMLSAAQKLEHPFTQVYALNWAARLAQYWRDIHRVYELSEMVIALATEHAFGQYQASGILLRGWVLVMQGQDTEGIDQIRHGLEGWRATGSELHLTYYLGLLASAHATAGQVETGLSVLGEALAVVERTAERYYEAELYRLQGELWLRQALPDAPHAETCFQQALDIARQQQAKSWELRVALSLSRLWQQQDKRDEARELLAPLYGWFTEGSDTADLQEATMLLDEFRA